MNIFFSENILSKRSVVAKRLLLPSRSLINFRQISSTLKNDEVASEPLTKPYHAGLRETLFSNKCDIISHSQCIPIFRVLNYDGELEGSWKCPLSQEEALERYTFMVKLNVWDLMLYNVQRQGRFSFYIQNQGEECLQTAIGDAIEHEDELYCQYRELGVLMRKGFQLRDALAQCFSTCEDEGKGRQMPISYTKKSIGLQTICTPLGSRIPQAAGAGYAFKLEKANRAALSFFGEGAASEGDFHAALNFAAVRSSQTIFVCRNNGYAISTPVNEQYIGDGIAIRGLAYGIDTVRVDGNDYFATYIATKKAREICVTKSKPVLIECMTYRYGHHSTSDDSSQYRPADEMSVWTQPGIEGISRFRRFLERHKLWDQEKEMALRKEAKQSMVELMKEVGALKTHPIVDGIFDDVYDKPPWHLQEQKREFEEHLKRNRHLYDLQRYPPLDS